MQKRILKFLSSWGLVIIWALVIFKFSSGAAPRASSLYWPNFFVMKTGHFLFFGFLAILIYRALRAEGISRKKAAIWAVIFTFLYGISDEIHQMFTQGREARVRDAIIDGVGAMIVTYIVYKYLPLLPKKVQLFLLKFGLT